MPTRLHRGLVSARLAAAAACLVAAGTAHAASIHVAVTGDDAASGASWAEALRTVGEGLSEVVDRDQLERGFRRLSLEHRAVVVLHHYLDWPLEQIAETLGVPTGTVRSRLHHAMRGLRAALDADARPVAREVAG